MKRGVICILFCFLLMAVISGAKGEESSTNSPESNVDSHKLVKTSVLTALRNYNLEFNKSLEEDIGEDRLPTTDYKIAYFIDTYPKYCPLCKSEMEKMLEAFFYDSSLAKDDKITLTIFSPSKHAEIQDFLAEVMTSIFLKKGGFQNGNLPSPEEVKALLKKVHFTSEDEIGGRPAKGVDSIPALIVYKNRYPGASPQIIATYGVRVVWPKIDQMILSKTPNW